jgi:hypothetical protein
MGVGPRKHGCRACTVDRHKLMVRVEVNCVGLTPIAFQVCNKYR